MRVPLLIIAALTLAACGKKNEADSNLAGSENLTADSIVSNDVTAIDAVTGDAANMAADVDVNYDDVELNSGNDAPDKAKASRPSPTHKPTTKPVSTPASNSVAETTGNSE